MEPTRVFDLLPRLKEKFDKPDILSAKENGKWVNYSTDQFISNVNDLSHGLLSIGIGKGDHIAILANNRPEWHFADYACQQVAAVTVPVYPTISDNDLKFILNDADVKLIFVSSKELYQKIKEIASTVSSVKSIYTFDKIEGANNWTELRDAGKKAPDVKKLEALKNSVGTDDLLTILYTSGTTGTPKGVMLSHKNLISNSLASQTLAPFEKTWRALSFLPLNHVYERMLEVLYLYLGVSIYFAESIESVGANLKEVKPQIFATVPRLLEKVYDRIVGQGELQKGIKRKLFFWSLNLGLRYELNGANGWWYEFQLWLANKLVFTKWRAALGGGVVAIASGGAALQPRLARVFNAAKITVLEGYGLTETSPVVAVNNFEPNSICFGTVGPILKNLEVKFAADGEILVKGPSIMMGYYNRPDATAEAIDKEGFFHTGDIGTMVDGRFLKITDRKKEIFKTSGGKYIAPLMIENKLKESPFIEQALVIGEGQKFASAFIVPAFVYLKDWCQKKNVPCSSNEEMINSELIRKQIITEVERVNSELAQYEKIKKPELMSHEWTIEGGEMTPKLSLKRKVILENNKALFAKIYAD